MFGARLIFPPVALLAGFAGSTRALASGPEDRDALAIVPIIVSGPGAGVTAGSVTGDVAAIAGRHLGLTVLSTEELFVSDPRGQQSIADCGSDEACIADRLRALRAQVGLVVVVNQVSTPPFIAVRLVDTQERRTIGSIAGHVKPEESSVSGAVRARARKLLAEAGYQPAGRVVVVTEPADAVILAPPGVQPDRGTTNVFTLPPGTYRFTAERPGHDSAESTIELTSDQSTWLRLVLDRETSMFGSAWFWAGVGMAVAVGAASVAVMAYTSSRCICVASEDDPCSVCLY